MHAALPLVEAGLKVMMLHGGVQPNPGQPTPPQENFEDIRTSYPEQWQWFLGQDFSSIPIEGLRGGLGGGMASGNRSYVTRHTEQELPIISGSTQIIQSLAEGGLGAAWGGTCAVLSKTDLATMGLPAADMPRWYREVCERIGVSGNGEGMQLPLKLDHHATATLLCYTKRKQWFDKRSISVEQPPSAILTQDLGTRKSTTYSDMDYYADPKRSLYRPEWTLEELRKFANFRDHRGLIANSFIPSEKDVTVHARTMEDHRPCAFQAKHVVLAAGAINSARIALASLSISAPIPFLCKPHAFIACLRLAGLRERGPKERISTCQLLVTDHTPNIGGMERSCAQLYSYRSFLLFRLLQSVPLPAPEALLALSCFTQGLVIADIRFPSIRTAACTLALPDPNQPLGIEVERTPMERQHHNEALRAMKSALFHLRLLPLKTMILPEGSTSHYAGSIPIQTSPQGHLSAAQDGSLHQVPHITVADASVFRALPPLPHTLTIMANARRIGSLLAAKLRS